MRRLVTLYLLLCVLCISSCHRRPTYPSSLLRADSLADANATEALSLLHQLEADTATWSEAARMYHRLLTVKAQDKAYIPHTSDSVMLPILHYYEHGGDKDLLPTAYYYMGSTYRDLNDAPRALEYYQKALDVMPGDKHLKVKTKVYAQIGYLFLYQRLYEKAMNSFLNSYQCDSILKDTIGIVYSLRDIALCYANTTHNELGIAYLKKAISYADAIKNEKMSRIASSQLASLYLQRGDYELAYDAIKPSLAHLDSTNISSVYSIAASIHQHLGHRDSSTYYYNKLLVYGDSYAKADAYYQLAKISISDKQNSEIVSLLENYYNQANTRKSLAATESLAKMSALYDYQVHEREKIEAQHRADTFRLYSLIGVAVLFIITLIFIAYGQYYKRKELKTKVRMNLLAAMHEEEHRRSQAYIQENEKKIVELTKAISCLEENDTQRIEQLENAVQQLDLENQAAKAKIEKHEKAVKAIEISSLRISLINKADKGQILRKEDIKDIETLLNTNFPHFIDRIRNIDGINETDYRVTLLQKMKLMPKHICVLLCKESGTVSNVRKRLYKKVFKVMGTPKDWDDFVDLL